MTTIKHGGNPDLVLRVVATAVPRYGPGVVVMASGNGGWYVGIADKGSPVLLWSPNFYTDKATALSYFESEKQR